MNGAELFNSDYNNNFQKTRPNVWSVIDILEEIQPESTVKMRSANVNGAVLENVDDKTQRMIYWWKAYHRKEITQLHYIKIMGYSRSHTNPLLLTSK